MTLQPQQIAFQLALAVALTTAVAVTATASAKVEPQAEPSKSQARLSETTEEHQRRLTMQAVIRTLNEQRQSVSKLACERGTARIALRAGGFSFGHLVATSNMESPCRNIFNFSELEGLDDDLADKVFGWSDERPTLADFQRISTPARMLASF
ncbi:hypothetical protein N9H93_01590 [Rhizobiaceae bacterium]|nr:hypothetical protein [Rhizobiaceae bacterium]